MASKITVEMWACVDSAGDYAVGNSEEAAREKYEEDVQALSESSGFRLVKINVAVPLPEPVELTGEASEVETASLTSVS
jgi:hypothetical protein